MSFYKRRDVKASRRDRRCDWCSRWILAGTPYAYMAGTSDGDFFSLGYCPTCFAEKDEAQRQEEERRKARQIEHQEKARLFRERLAAAQAK